MATTGVAIRLRGGLRRLWGAWIAVQVEFQGRYSVARLHALHDYMTNLSTKRLVLICLLTPLPCLALGLLNDAMPLAPPEAGVYENWRLWLRAWAVTCFVDGSVVLQMGQTTPRLRMQARHVLTIGLLAGTISIAVVFAAAALLVFPLPFGMLVAAPPSVLVMFVCFVYIWGPQWRVDAALRRDVKRQMEVFTCQVTLTFVYPLYIFGFVSFRGSSQTLFVIVLPFIKLAGKNWISRTLADQHDVKPETVIFNVEVFNALYVSNALQNASSLTATAAIMAVDLLQFWLSMLDVMEVLKGVKQLMAKIPHGHPVGSESFLQLALRMVAIEAKRKATATIPTGVETWKSGNFSSKENGLDAQRDAEALVPFAASNKTQSHGKRILPLRAQVFPICPPSHRTPLHLQTRIHPDIQSPTAWKAVAAVDPGASLSLEAIFSREERLLFIRKTARVLFITEYIVLVEYTEVVLPIVYSMAASSHVLEGLHRMVLFQLPNCAYYPSLAGLSSAQFWATVANVLSYGALEFASLLMTIVVLKHMLGFASFRQLAFVLDTQAELVQTKLVVWFVYIMQVSLVHLGAFRVAFLELEGVVADLTEQFRV
ncbi:hypothetical protein BBJ28_00004776 [Nothophytophthora sp. Chile5]|nr:hypothetical protein BBJ28_00004776 [Nothophytophthora sp. Chile5]